VKDAAYFDNRTLLRAILTLPRPSARSGGVRDARERATATDFDAFLESADPGDSGRGDLGAWRVVADFEVTLCRDATGGWAPTRSIGLDQVGAGWIHGYGLLPYLERVKAWAGPLADPVARRILGALSGTGWPGSIQTSPFFTSVVSIDLHGRHLPPDAILPGDVVRRESDPSGTGIVVSIGATDRRGATQYHVLGVPDPLEESHEWSESWWASTEVARVPRRDPYRRYLAMCTSEDDPDRQARRAGRPSRWSCRRGVLLPWAAWDTAFWRIANLERVDLTGRLSYRPLGREHWAHAADDCLDRRERAERASEVVTR
jgi:hypothetical protein